MARHQVTGSLALSGESVLEKNVELFASEDEIFSRPRFRADVAITVDQVESIVGHYPRFKKKVRCQVYDSRGQCGHLHLKGWLALTKNGHEGLIGGVCCKKKFRDHVTFSSKIAGARRQLRIQEARQKISEFTSVGSAFRFQLDSAKKSWAAIKSKYAKLFSSIGRQLGTTLADRAKRGYHNVSIESLHIEREKDGSKTRRWTPHQIGNVVGLSIFIPQLLEEIDIALSDVLIAFNEALHKETKPAFVERLIQRLQALAGVESSIQKFEREFNLFCQAENLKLVCFLVPSEAEQELLAEYMLRTFPQIAQGKNISAQLTVRSLYKELRQQYGNEFRVLTA